MYIITYVSLYLINSNFIHFLQFFLFQTSGPISTDAINNILSSGEPLEAGDVALVTKAITSLISSVDLTDETVSSCNYIPDAPPLFNPIHTPLSLGTCCWIVSTVCSLLTVMCSLRPAKLQTPPTRECMWCVLVRQQQTHTFHLHFL